VKQIFAIVGLGAFVAIFVVSLLIAVGVFQRRPAVSPVETAQVCKCDCPDCDCNLPAGRVPARRDCHCGCPTCVDDTSCKSSCIPARRDPTKDGAQ
jgi:hypothetical protein